MRVKARRRISCGPRSDFTARASDLHFFVMTPFERTVRKVVKAIPRGTTLCYGQVALFANKPGAARAVVRALHALEGIPWWRVIRSDGTIAAQVAVEQSRKLRAEGVAVKGRRVAIKPGKSGPGRRSARRVRTRKGARSDD